MSTFTLKFHQGKSKNWCAFLTVLFKGKYGGVPPIFKTLILLHWREIGLRCDILLGSRCIYSFSSCYRYKFEHRKPKSEDFRKCCLKAKYVIWVLVIFFLDVPFHNFERPLKTLRIKFSSWSFVYTMKSQQEKLEDRKSKKLVVLLVLFKDRYFPVLILCIASHFLFMFFVNWTVLGIIILRVSNKLPTFCGKYLRVFHHRTWS